MGREIHGKMTHQGAVFILCMRSCDISSTSGEFVTVIFSLVTTHTNPALFKDFLSLHSWVGKLKATAQCYEKPKLKLRGVWTWIHRIGVHMQATEILCPLAETVWDEWPFRQEAWLISPPNTIGRSPIFSSISAAPFKIGTEFSVGLLTIRFFPQYVSRTSSSAMFLLQPSLEDLCNGREKLRKWLNVRIAKSALLAIQWLAFFGGDEAFWGVVVAFFVWVFFGMFSRFEPSVWLSVSLREPDLIEFFVFVYLQVTF